MKKNPHNFFIFEILRLDFSKFNSIILYYTSEANQDVKINISHQQIQKINVFAYNIDLIVLRRQKELEAHFWTGFRYWNGFLMYLRKLFFACTNG